jgi:hypothetical protein
MIAPPVFLGSDEQAVSSWDDVKRLIGWLNGSYHTEVFIGHPDMQRFMAISGGNAGRYVVVVQDAEKGYFTLLNPTKSEELVKINIGGLEDYYPENQSQDFDAVLRVAKTYFETGNRDAAFHWKKGK